MKEHKFANGIVEFREAIEIDQEFFAGWLNRRRENEPNDYTIDDDGNYINRGGYRFTPEEYLSAPGRFLNLLPVNVLDEDKAFVEALDDALFNCLQRYVEIFPEVSQSVWWRSPGHVATYTKGQHMGSHHDNAIPYRPGVNPENEHAIQNVITASVALNDDYSGGQLEFPHAGLSIRPPIGTALFYPSNYIGAHGVKPVIFGERYSYLQFYGHGTPKAANIVFKTNSAEWFPNLLSARDQEDVSKRGE